jgi:hypothetical protein
MKFKEYLTELSSNYGKGITFIDIDQTIFDTKDMIYVMKNNKIVNKLSNQTFNTYTLGQGESFDFREFRDADLFKKTSIPIPKVVDRIKRMFKHMDIRNSKVVFLTARADFDDKEVFLSTFSQVGIPINDIYVERAGNMKTGTISQRKKSIIMKYIRGGEYRRVRLVDDHKKNIADFLSIETSLPRKVVDAVKKKHGIKGEESINPIEFYGLLVNKDGKLKRV